MIDNDTTFRVAERQLSSGLGSDTIVLDANKGFYWSLNSVGSRIWELVQEPRSFGEIVDTLLEEYEVSRETCEAEVRDLLAKMQENGLVQTQ